MTRPHRDAFPEMMGQVMRTAERFGHRQHVYLTWLSAVTAPQQPSAW
jgi:hypothetical protein